MKLSDALKGLPCTIAGDAGVTITGVAYDSRRVEPGDLFVALPGHHVDGSMFIAEAVRRGAAAVATSGACPSAGVPIVHTADPLQFLAQASAAVYEHPDRRLLLVGVTGTNGKTTITYILESIFTAAGILPGVMGTVNYRYGTTMITAGNTTPQSADVYRILRSMADAGVRAAVMEVSSHALALGRVDGIEYDIAIFTNLTRDHLDFHATMERYFEAKSLLFSRLRPGKKQYPKCAIINGDDPWADRLSARVSGADVITYGCASSARVRAENISYTHRGTAFTLVTPDGRADLAVGFLGAYNVHNILAAAAAGLGAGISFEAVVAGIRAARPAPGRMEMVDAGQPFAVIVDYAHTDDALLNVLTAVRELKPRRVVTVFGCGGDRDRTKRPIMGETAARLSDHVFVTSDNPRTEDPGAIAREVEAGIRAAGRKNYTVILDRAQAIAEAVGQARAGDVVVIAGKGHEDYQIIGETKHHFNDGETARACIERLYGKHHS